MMMITIVDRPDNVFRARDEIASEYVDCVHCHGSGREGRVAYAGLTLSIWEFWYCCVCGGRGAFRVS